MIFIPLFPWLTFYLLGFWAWTNNHGQARQVSGESISFVYPLNNKLFRFLEYVGKNSLIIYIFHQPITFLFILNAYSIKILKILLEGKGCISALF